VQYLNRLICQPAITPFRGARAIAAIKAAPYSGFCGAGWQDAGCGEFSSK
jgi:hypothetical protein